MKVLVLGATGMFGHVACRVLADAHEVIGTYRPATGTAALLAHIPDGVELAPLDPMDLAAFEALVAEFRPNAIINGIGVVKQREAARDRIQVIEINSLFPHRAQMIAAEAGARFVHLSTDCVFSGERGGYTEDDRPDPVDLYGHSKLLGEPVGARCLVIRTSIIGPQIGAGTGLLEWFRSQRGGRTRGFTRAVYSGLTTAEIARVIVAALATEPFPEGLFHVASGPINKYDLLCAVNDRLGLGVEIEPDDALRCDRSLDGSKWRAATGLRIASQSEMLDRLVEDLRHYDAWKS